MSGASERLRSFLARLYDREGFRGPVVTLLSGTAVTLVLSYLAVPILTRLYSPEEFGVSDYFVTMVSVLATFSSLRYEDALMLPREDERADAIFRLALLLACISAAALAVASVWSTEISLLLGVEGLASWFWMLAPTLLLLRFWKLNELRFTRLKRFRVVTAGEVANKVTMLGVRLGAGAATRLGAGGLIGGFFAGHLVSAAYAAGAMRRTGLPVLASKTSPGSLRKVAARYRRFPLYSMPSALLNTVVTRLPIFLLPLYFGVEAVGLFGRAFVALAVPLGLIGAAISQVFFVHAAEAVRQGRLDQLTQTVHARLVMIGAFPAVLLVFVGPELFAFVFGPEWRAAGDYGRLLAFWFFAGSIASPLTRLFDVLERQRAELSISIVMLAGMSVALIVGGRSGDILLTMALAGAAGVAVRALHIGAMLSLARVPLGGIVRPYVRYLLLSALLAAPVWLLRDVLPLWGVTVASAVAGGVYAGIIAWKEGLLPTEGTARD